MIQYRSSKCNMAVIVITDNPPIKACKCEAPITAEMQAKAKGKGGVKA